MQMSRRIMLASALLAGGAQTAFAADARAELLTRHMANTTTPGMAALVIRNFRAEREIVAGVRVINEAAPIERGDRWHLGSDGKAMTATMVARLVEQGVLAWDRPLAEMLPQLAATMHETYRDVTLVELFSHRSGLPSDTEADFFASFYNDPAPMRTQRARYIDTALRAAPVAAKRTEFSYSNNGFVTAAVCAEHATGSDFETLMQQEVFRRLRMRSIRFDQYGGPGEPSGHVDGRAANQPRDANPRMFAPAGGISMSLPDWSRFCIDHMRGHHGHGRILSPDTYRFLHTPVGAPYAALGWGYLEVAVGRRGPALFHAGSDGNWTALVMLFHETGNGVLVASNAFTSMRGDRAANEAMREICATLADPAPQAG
jgi:CubicO group peptidase (beta-lactamase class C family)